ncbi:cytochrome C [Devosia sp. FKR38]|uniref:c-type cytochrome n=1 Tax=Devosia sp. FKR38 TaxID=2562312 RepID=UPI0010C151F1|nr:cytochrome C [Devosia sp. FKR38]
MTMRRLPLLVLLPVLLMGSAQAAERQAKTNFVLKCIGCHLADGTGLPGQGIPDFVGKVGVFAGLPEGRAYLLHVPGVIGSSLTDNETAEVLNYIMDKWAGDSLPKDFVRFTGPEVAVLKATNIGNVVNYRRVVADKLAKSGLTVADYPWP